MEIVLCEIWLYAEDMYVFGFIHNFNFGIFVKLKLVFVVYGMY